MKKALFSLLLSLLCSVCCGIAVAKPSLTMTGLRVEGMTGEPLGLDTSTPRFSWLVQTDGERNVIQTAFHILVASSSEHLAEGEGDLWDSGEVESDEQLWVPFGGKPLKSAQHAYWKVRIKTRKGWTSWSQPQHFCIGLLGETQWRGRWIGLESMQPGEHGGQHPCLAARYLRKEFQIAKPVRRATAFVSGLGLYRLFINGQPVSRDVLTPLPSDYRKTIYYDTYDVTRPVCCDTIATIGIVLGNGRFFAPRQDKPYKNTTFGLPKCRLNLLLEYADGTTDRLVTDETWRLTTLGPIRNNNEYDGEHFDARLDLGSWTQSGYDDSHWQKAERSALPQGTLRGRVAPNMTTHATHRPVSRKNNVLDFGQNMAGWLSFVPQGRPGDTIRVRYAERLNADGTLYTANLRDAFSEDIYICSGKEHNICSDNNASSGKEHNICSDKESAYWHPTFVTHGFRYAEVQGPATDFLAEEVYDDMAETGWFTCSDTILNKVFANARRGIAANYKGMPVDCPQRNERQPWLGDRTVGSLGESFLFNNERLYTKWMRDIAESQREDGCIPDVAPAFWNYYTDDVTWPSCLPFTSMMLKEQFGNDEALRRWLPNIRQWARHIMDCYTSKEGLITKDKYGDWCVPPEKLELIHSNDPARKTDGSLIATAYMIKVLEMLGRLDTIETAEWREQRDRMVEAFNRKYLICRPNTSPRPAHPLYPDSTYYGNNTVTSNLLPLAFGICPDSLRPTVAKQVVKSIVADNQNHVSCGVIGISWLLRVLSDEGYGSVAYALATQKTYPSWGYMAEQGATTIWELWNGDHADPSMNSGNHVMLLGDLLTWCYQTLGGIRSTDAYKHIVLRPDFSILACDSVDCRYDSPYGIIQSRWKKTPMHLDWHVEVPCNTTAEVCFPDGTRREMGSGSYDFSVAIPSKAPGIVVSDELIQPGAPSCHAPTLVETSRGDLVVAYFAGTYERNPDCNIYVNIKRKGHSGWGKPILVADGDGTACWNPVLTEMPDGELWLFYKVGKAVKDWTGWLVKSTDGGYSWGRPEALPEGFLGPVKNKPLLIEANGAAGSTGAAGSAGATGAAGTTKATKAAGAVKATKAYKLLCGSSTEEGGWRFHVEILDLETGQWRYVGPVESTVALKTDDNQPHPIDCIQPSILQLSDGRLQVLMRTHNARLAQSFSSDDGETWSPVTLSEVENNQSGTDAVTLRDGRHVLVYNNFETLPLTKKGPRTPLSLAVSEDGRVWSHWLTLEDAPTGEYSYPAIIEGRDGTLHVVYTFQRTRIAYKQVRRP